MRMFLYVNSLYLKELQYGLQGMHVLGDMMVKYHNDANPLPPNRPSRFELMMDWAKNHKTVIIYKGINSGNLQVIYDELKDTPYPCVKFHEDQESLGGALTAVGIILPEYLYVAADLMRNGKTLDEAAVEIQHFITGADEAIIRRLMGSSLA